VGIRAAWAQAALNPQEALNSFLTTSSLEKSVAVPDDLSTYLRSSETLLGQKILLKLEGGFSGAKTPHA